MEFSFDAALENKFEAMSLPGLLIYIKKEQLEISQQATDFLLLFWNEMFVWKKDKKIIITATKLQ